MQKVMAEEKIEHSLLRRAQAGEREAFQELAERSRSDLTAWIRRRIGANLRPDLEPEDIIQGAYTRAFESIGRFQWRGEGSFFRWLTGIAGNLILKGAERARRGRSIEICRTAARDEPISPSKAMRRGERFDRLERALAGLSPDHRQVIVLARIDGLQMAEIARRMSRSEGAVRSLLLRALKELKRTFGETESLGLPARRLSEETRHVD